MKNQCRPESADSELSFVTSRPLVMLGDTIGSFPPVKRPLHSDRILCAFDAGTSASRDSAIVLVKSTDGDDALERHRQWWDQNIKYVGTQFKLESVALDGQQYVATYAQLHGEVALNTPGKLRVVSDEWLLKTLSRAQSFKQEAMEVGLSPSFFPSLTSSCWMFSEYCIATFGLMNLDSGASNSQMIQKASSADTYVRLLYWLLAGINLFEENAEEPSALTKWVPNISLRTSELIRAALTRDVGNFDFADLIKDLKKESVATAGPAADTKSGAQTDKGLKRVAGMRKVKHVIEREVLSNIRDPERFKSYGLKSISSILLFGPSGCGKTHLVKCLAEELKYLLIQVRPSDVSSMYVRESTTRIREYFDNAASNKPCILFFDEFDSLVPDRGRLSSHQNYKIEEVNEMLSQLDLAKEKGIFVIAASNQPFIIDPGIFGAGRFDKIIYLGPPDEDDRVELLEHFMHKRPVSENLDLQSFAARLDGFSAADVRALVEDAARVALSLGQAPISQPILGETLSRIPPSITSELERKFEKFIDRGYSTPGG